MVCIGDLIVVRGQYTGHPHGGNRLEPGFQPALTPTSLPINSGWVLLLR